MKLNGEVVRRIGTILFVASLVGLFLPPINTTQGWDIQDMNQDVNIHIPDETPQFSGTRQVIIAGVWHEIELNLSQAPVNITLILYQGIGVPTTTNTTNYYEYWYRSLETQKWIDPEYGSFVNATLCNIEGSNVTFGIGIDQNTTYNAEWKLVIRDDNGALVKSEKRIWVERPKTGLSMSGGDFLLNAEPFTAGNLSSYPYGGHALVTNMGNVPLRMPVTFNAYANRITVVNLTQKLGPGEGANLNIMFKADSWSPRKISIKGTVRGEAMHIIPSGTVSLTTNYETSLSLKVNIGRSGMELGDLGNVRIQYSKSEDIAYNETLVLDAWVSGTTTVDFKISSNMMDIKSITMDDLTSSSTVDDLLLKEDSEYHFVITAYPKQSNTMGFINYEVSGYQVETTIFSTEISIGPKPPGYREDEPVSKTIAIGFMLLTVGLIGGIIGYYHFVLRKRPLKPSQPTATEKPKAGKEGGKKSGRFSRRGKSEGEKT
jgi:hypothetical protein